ncbi:MAG: hypothetical protein M3419_08060 [Actinomycetota bacterium]|nr:hypothetical protein [Actinomycetota bacterium]
MLTTTEPFLSAEIAYRRERMAAGLASSNAPRRPWLRRRTSSTGQAARHRVHRPFPALARTPRWR